MGVLSQLGSDSIFKYFEMVASVPHGSHNTKQISDKLYQTAKDMGLECRQDQAGNVIIKKPASPGYENADTVMLQGHMDMVCVKTADCTKDMAKEGIDLCTDGEWIWGDKTSLGGDDGVAIAIALAILERNDIPHPALEVVFTVDEEVGLVGAEKLDCSDLKAKKLINLDIASHAFFCVSCAGGLRMDCTIPAKRDALNGEDVYKFDISGLIGGHSGATITKGKANAIKILSRILYTAWERFGSIRLVSVNGGQFDNVICPEASGVVALPAGSDFAGLIAEFQAIYADEYALTDPDIKIVCEKTSASDAFTADSSIHAVRTLTALPYGVIERSKEFRGIAKTSINLGSIRNSEDAVLLSLSIRSNQDSQKEMVVQQVKAILQLAGGSVSERGRYPSWPYRRESAFRDMAVEEYKKLTGEEPKVFGTHGGLEVGLLIGKMPQLDCIAIGPEDLNVHSVEEKLNVKDFKTYYQYVINVLEKCR